MTAARSTTAETLFARICRATPQEAYDLALPLAIADRADLALDCAMRTHTREQGRAIARACSRESLVRAGGYAGEVLHQNAGAGLDTWGSPIRSEKRPVSLATW